MQSEQPDAVGSHRGNSEALSGFAGSWVLLKDCGRLGGGLGQMHQAWMGGRDLLAPPPQGSVPGGVAGGGGLAPVLRSRAQLDVRQARIAGGNRGPGPPPPGSPPGHRAALQDTQTRRDLILHPSPPRQPTPAGCVRQQPRPSDALGPAGHSTG